MKVNKFMKLGLLIKQNISRNLKCKFQNLLFYAVRFFVTVYPINFKIAPQKVLSKKRNLTRNFI